MNLKEIINLAYKWEKYGENVLYLTPYEASEIIRLIDARIINNMNSKLIIREIHKNTIEKAKLCYNFVKTLTDKHEKRT